MKTPYDEDINTQPALKDKEETADSAIKKRNAQLEKKSEEVLYTSDKSSKGKGGGSYVSRTQVSGGALNINHTISTRIEGVESTLLTVIVDLENAICASQLPIISITAPMPKK